MSVLMLEAGELSLGYGSVPFVRELDLEVRAGEVLTILGANGAGKSTTLMGLAGHLKPHKGSVVLGGSEVRTPIHKRAKSGVSLVTQDRCVFMGMTLRDNFKVAGVELERGLEHFPELGDHVNRPVGLLSGGQQQMIAVARAIARGPNVLLADEFSLGLAPMVIDRILQVFRDDGDEGEPRRRPRAAAAHQGALHRGQGRGHPAWAPRGRR
jgi:branched-chain amino acid transport system ATP-binding protein